MSSATAPPGGDINKGPLVLTLVTVTTSLALIAVGTRTFVRVTIVRNVGWDDYAIIVGVVMAITVMVFEIMSVNHGNGRHMFYLDSADITEASKWSRATIPPNLMACLMSRISLCLFMMRIVNHVRTYKILLWVIISLNSIATFASIIQLLVGCRPLEKLWNPKTPGVCFPAKVTLIIGLTQATTAIASDWVLALLPIMVLKNLNMARRTKIALSILMGTGLFVGVAALVKTLQLYTLGSRKDVTWDTLTLTCWSIVEQNLGIIAVNVAAIRPLFSRFFKIGTSVESPNRYLGYDLGNMVGTKRGTVYPNAVSTVTARKPPADDNGSESNLVVGNRGDGITKTMSISLHSNVRDAGSRSRWSHN